MKIVRSPRYPAISLVDAVDKIKIIFSNEHRSPMMPVVAADHLGYSGLNGSSMKVLSALKKYGLLEGRGEELSVSNDAITIIADENVKDQSERIDALERTLVGFDLFAELNDKFSVNVSEKNIVAFLTKTGFKPPAARKAACSYFASVVFVEEARRNYIDADSCEIENLNESVAKISPENTIDGAVSEHSFTTLSRKVADMRQETFALDTGEVVIQWPSRMTKESFEDFSDWLEILKRKVRRTVDDSHQ
ncbi:MAG: hypothetical protein LC540_01625 [Candidatus Thiodiazotropha sp.]|nr:hypothetical protein [Candidatus Thiodiazotropha sp.]